MNQSDMQFCALCYRRNKPMRPFRTCSDGFWFACADKCYGEIFRHETSFVAFLPKFWFCVELMFHPGGSVGGPTTTSQTTNHKSPLPSTPQLPPTPPLQATRLVFSRRQLLVNWHVRERPHSVVMESYAIYPREQWSNGERLRWIATGSLIREDDVTTIRRDGPDPHGVTMVRAVDYHGILDVYDSGKCGLWAIQEPRWFIKETDRQAHTKHALIRRGRLQRHTAATGVTVTATTSTAVSAASTASTGTALFDVAVPAAPTTAATAAAASTTATALTTSGRTTDVATVAYDHNQLTRKRKRASGRIYARRRKRDHDTHHLGCTENEESEASYHPSDDDDDDDSIYKDANDCDNASGNKHAGSISSR